mmetsp:Transcript_12464/g.26190  ORF Transcript_12464/g.26190 Transcript_12464/m.26190 type:complete len:220 (+) Transcript_12464:73-732(+)
MHSVHARAPLCLAGVRRHTLPTAVLRLSTVLVDAPRVLERVVHAVIPAVGAQQATLANRRRRADFFQPRAVGRRLRQALRLSCARGDRASGGVVALGHVQRLARARGAVERLGAARGLRRADRAHGAEVPCGAEALALIRRHAFATPPARWTRQAPTAVLHFGEGILVRGSSRVGVLPAAVPGRPGGAVIPGLARAGTLLRRETNVRAGRVGVRRPVGK